MHCTGFAIHICSRVEAIKSKLKTNSNAINGLVGAEILQRCCDRICKYGKKGSQQSSPAGEGKGRNVCRIIAKKMRTKITLFDEIEILSCWIIPASFCLPGWEGYRVGGGGNGAVFRTFWKAFGTLWGSLGVLEGFHGPMVKVLFLVIVMVPVIMTHGHGQ